MAESTSLKISIITCFYDVEEFIEETIRSVLKQDYQNWQLLLIDDGSKDSSTRIAKEYALKYPEKIFYHEHENHKNKGLSFSRNEGIEKATGEFIAFLDADDIWLENYLSHQAELLKQHSDCAMICEATEYWYNWKNFEYENTIIEIGTQQDCMYSPPQLMLNLYPLGIGEAPCMCGILIKRNILEKYGGFDESFKGLYEDQIFLSKIYLHEKIFISSACNNRYRQRANSLIGASLDDGKYYIIRKKFLQWLEKYMIDKKITYPEVSEKLQKALIYEPLVSVIICFFNEEIFLDEAINSVLEQTYKNWELMLVNDGSTDKSFGIAIKYADKFKNKILYCEHDGHGNKGLSASRNLGIKKSKGDLIALLDADDAWLEGKLLTQVSIFQRNPEIGMVAEASLYWKSWNNINGMDQQILIGAEAELVYEPYELIYKL